MTELATMVTTTRFGVIAVDFEDMLTFPDGLIGLPGSDYALVPAGPGPFIWLQSLADSAVALPLTHPERFFPAFALELGEEDAERLGADAARLGADAARLGADAARPGADAARLGADAARLGADAARRSDIYVTVRAAPAAEDCTANLRAPIVVLGEAGGGGRRAHQVINQAAGAPLRAPLFTLR